MRYLAAALVTIALCGASLAGDLFGMTEKAQRGWDYGAAVALIIFVLLIALGGDDD